MELAEEAEESRTREGGGGGDGADITSNNRHLTRGENTTYLYIHTFIYIFIYIYIALFIDKYAGAWHTNSMI